MAKEISIFNYQTYNLSEEKREEIGKNILTSQEPIIDVWDYFRRLSDKSIISYTNFTVYHGGNYYQFECEDCKSTTHLPFLKKECIICNSTHIGSRRKHVQTPSSGKGYGFGGDELSPELLKAAEQDIINNPPPQNIVQESIDWNYLNENL